MIDMTKGNSSKLIIKFALPMILGNIFQQVYNLVDTVVVGKFVGVDALAAVGSSFAIVVFVTSIIIGLTYMPVQDFGNAFAIYVAQNKGAGKIHRIKDGIKSSIKMIIAFCAVILTLILLFSRNIMLLFIDKSENEVMAIGREYLSVVAVFYVLVGILFLLYGLYRGLGFLKMSIILTVISLGTRVVLAYILSGTKLGASGIWWAIPIGWLLADVIGFIKYKKSFFKNEASCKIRK